MTLQEEIKADPLSCASDVRWLSTQDARAAVQHPNCPDDLWWELAKRYPLDALSSVLFPMLTLEDPGRWQQLEEASWLGWLTRPYINDLPLSACYRLAVECAARVLPSFESVYPNDKRPREALDTVRRLHLEDPAQTELACLTAKAAADESADKVQNKVYIAGSIEAIENQRKNNACTVAYAVWFATRGDALNAADYARSAARGCMDGTLTPAKAEARWQWERVLWYLREASNI